MEPFIVITAPEHFSQQAVDNISESAKGIGELIGCKVIVEASGLQIRVEPPVHGVWREDLPSVAGWYRVWTQGWQEMEVVYYGAAEDNTVVWSDVDYWDHTPIEFAPTPEGE